MENKIGIDLTRDQYRQLLRLLYLGQWMSLSFTDHEDEDVLDLEQYVFSFSRDFESQDMIGYDEEVQLFFPTVAFEEEIFDMIDDYDEFSFWEGLAERLAKRDLHNRHGESYWSTDEDSRSEEEQNLIDKYLDYFERSGLTELNVPVD